MTTATSADDHLIVANAIDSLPASARRELALGPLDDPDCRVCQTLNPMKPSNDDAVTILNFHELGPEGLAEAGRDALGKDRRLSVDEHEAAIGYQRMLERLPPTNIQRTTVESLAGDLNWWRCLYVYLLAGWRP
jgi:hypothetical protein